uniref:LacI family DNA-binding transcriptional regulator n=1 Tax=Lentzea indica TaxID=2604800 RepID=UPI0028A6B610|nr:LacI family DNA-binding transcriptional regulator [Lentzea indica]
MVTISDVARHAGVAPSTVSYVLTGKRSISRTRSRRSGEASGSWATSRTPVTARSRRAART